MQKKQHRPFHLLGDVLSPGFPFEYFFFLQGAERRRLGPYNGRFPGVLTPRAASFLLKNRRARARALSL